MKVKELLNILKEEDPNLPVYIYPRSQIHPEALDRLEINEVENYCGTTLNSLGLYLTTKGIKHDTLGT